MEFTEFATWQIMGTFAGSTLSVMILTQFIKGWNLIKKLPTQALSYILALFILICAQTFTTGIGIEDILLTLFNAVLVSIAANGGYSGISKIFGNQTQGNFLVDTLQPGKDIYRLDLGDNLDKISNLKTLTLKVDPNADLYSEEPFK